MLQEGASLLASASQDPVPASTSEHKNLVVFYCMAAFIVNQINFSQLPAFLPDYAERIVGVSPTWVGLILGTQGAAGLLACSVAPQLIKRVATRPALVVSQFVLAASSLTLALVADVVSTKVTFIWLCMTMRTMQGFADGIVQVSVMSIILRSVPEKTSGMYVGLTEGLRSIGTLLGPVLGGFLYQSSGWKLPLIVSSSLVTIIAIAFMLLGHSVDHSRLTQIASTASLTKLYCIPQSSLVILACGVSIFTLGFFEPTLLPYLTEEPFRMSTGQVGLLMTGTSIMMGITAAIAGTGHSTPPHACPICTGLAHSSVNITMPTCA